MQEVVATACSVLLPRRWTIYREIDSEQRERSFHDTNAEQPRRLFPLERSFCLAERELLLSWLKFLLHSQYSSQLCFHHRLHYVDFVYWNERFACLWVLAAWKRPWYANLLTNWPALEDDTSISTSCRNAIQPMLVLRSLPNVRHRPEIDQSHPDVALVEINSVVEAVTLLFCLVSTG